jgi:HK97 family phage major capsid protein
MPVSNTLERDVTELRSKIRDLTATAATKRAAAEKLVEDEKAAGRNPVVGLTDDDKESFGRIDAAYKEADADAQSAAELRGRLETLLSEHGHLARDVSGGDPEHPAARKARSIGALVLASAPYQGLIASGQLAISTGAFQTDPVAVLSKEQTRILFGGRRGATVFADAGDGTPLVPSDEQLIPPVEIPKRMPTLLDMINVSSTGRDAVTWTRMTARTNSAATTAFGTAVSKSRYQYETVSSPVLRKGHHAVVDEGNVADQDEFRNIVDNELLSDLRIVVEEDALSANGNGTTEWEGIYNNSGIGDIDATGEVLADALHRAITTVRIQSEREPTGWGISPEDFEDYYLEKGTDGHYLHHRGPQEAQVRTIWGLPAMVSTVYTAPLVGDFFRGATLWIREGVNIVVGRIDDQLLEGLWTIRAQTRAAFAVKQPKAFCTVSNFES